MQYTIIVNGRSYDLPPKKLAVVKELDEVLKVDSVKGISVEQKFETLHRFMKHLVGEEGAKEMFGSERLEDIDLSELTLAVRKVVHSYDRPIQDFESEKAMQTINGLPIEKIISMTKAAEKLAAMPQNR
nr:MAG TPA: hypothetical protein [Caudoviricetes sp.]